MVAWLQERPQTLLEEGRRRDGYAGRMDEFWDWFRERWGLLTAGLIAVVMALSWWQGRPLSQPPGVLVPEEPVQETPESLAPWSRRQHLITPLATFSIRARVLGVERYRFDRAAELSPVDFALGWGPMSDSRILEAFSISQDNRWYTWTAAQMPIPESEVASHSANMHMIPLNKTVAKQLLAVRPGQIVDLRGQLVRADGPDGWYWISSLSRTDTGAGACEVIWVESVRVSSR